MRQGADRPVVARGAWGSVTCAVDARGRSPAWRFLRELEPGQLAKLMALFELMAEAGTIRNTTRFRKLAGTDLWEFKSDQVRVLCFQDGREWVLTSGLIKKSRKTPRTEIERAERIRREDLARRGDLR